MLECVGPRSGVAVAITHVGTISPMPIKRPAIAVGIGALLGVLAFVGLGSVADETDSPVSTTTTTSPALPPAHATAETTSPEPATSTTSPPAPVVPVVRSPLLIHATGDVNFDPSYIPRFVSEGYASAFDGLDGLFVEDDLTIVNLECAPSMLGSPLDKEFVFRCDTTSLPIIAMHGVDVVNLANNHSQDYGTTAMLDGALQARLAGLAPVGVGTTVESATSPALFDVGGWRIAVLGMGGVVPSSGWLATSDRPGMASGDDIEQMTAAVRAASRQADLVFVSIHWGVEGESEPRQDDVERATRLIEAGADAIFGHHPHRLGSFEFIAGKPVFWTLGNFVWPRLSDASATTAVATVEISADGEIGACLLPAFIERSGQPVLTAGTDCADLDE